MELISTIPFYDANTSGDFDYQEILGQLIDVVEEDANMLSILEYMDAIKPTENKEFWSYQNDFLYQTVTVAAAGGATVTSSGVAVTMVTGDGTKLRKGSVLMDAARNLFYTVSISGDAITLKPVSGVSTAIANDAVLSVPTNAVGEGKSNGDMLAIDPIRRSNQVQIFENGIQVSDLNMAGKTVVTLADGSQYYFYKLQDDAYRKHRIDVANNHLVGEYGEETDVDGATVLFSKGLDKWIEDYGVDDVTAAGVNSIDKNDFHDFNRKLDLVRSPNSGALVCGGEINNKIDDLFDTELSSGGVDRGVFGTGSNSRKAIDLGVNTFKVYGRTFDKIKLSQMDHPNVTAVSTFEFPDIAYFIPKGSIKTQSGGAVPRLCGRYLKFAEGINGRFHEKITGGLAPNPTSNDNFLSVRYTSWEGLDVNGADQFGRLILQQS